MPVAPPRLFLSVALLSGAEYAAGFASLSQAMLTARRASAIALSVDESTDDSSARAAGIEAFRERQRLRSTGEPLSVWSHGADPADFFVGPELEKEGDGYTAPTDKQSDAADELFEKVLREEKLPDGFGEGLEL